MQVMSKFLTASRQAYELDHNRVRLEAKIRNMEKESSHRMGERMKLEVELVELKNLAQELRMNIVEKDSRLDHLQKQNEELRLSLSQFGDEVIKGVQVVQGVHRPFGTNYVVGFEDFRMDALELFPGVDFDSIKLRTAAESSLLQMSSGDINIEDNTSTLLPAKDGSKFGGDAPSGLSP